MLTEARQAVADDLEAGGIVARPYTSEVLSPPCAFVVPGQPYLDDKSGRVDVSFTGTLLRLDVLLLVGEADPAPQASTVDELVERAFGLLDQRQDVVRVTRPGVIQPDPTREDRYVGAVLSLETITDRPTVPED